MKRGIRIDLSKIKDFAHKWHIVRFMLFGSVLSDDFGPHSDVDVLVDFEKNARIDLFDMTSMKDELEKIFDRKVDLIENGTIHNPYRRKSIESKAEIIYEA